jgi:anion-transporting  ArsA/GET3 family ATPase
MAGRQAMSRLFDVGAIEHTPRQIAPGVDALTVDPAKAVEDYLHEQLKVRALARRLANGRLLSKFFEAAPAVVEVATLGVLERLLRTDAKRWDAVFVDLEASGHAAMFLALPDVFDSIATGGPVRRTLDRMRGVFTDATRSSLFVVTQPEEIIVQETREFIERVRSDGSVLIGAVLLNECETPPLERDALAELTPYREWVDQDGDSAHRDDLEVVERVVTRAKEQAELAKWLGEVAGSPVQMIPRDLVDAAPSLERLGDALGWEDLRR